MMYQKLLLLSASFLSFSLHAQPLEWHKTWSNSSLYAANCQLAEHDARFLVTTERKCIETDQLGAVTGFFDNPTPSAYWVWTARKTNTYTGHPYFLFAQRPFAPTKDFSLAAYVPGQGIVHTLTLTDSLEGLNQAQPRILAINDSVYAVFGYKFYRQIGYTPLNGFYEIAKKDLHLSILTALRRADNTFLLADNNGAIHAIGQDGVVAWSRQAGVKLRKIIPAGNGWIGCGRDMNDKAAVLRLDASGETVWLKQSTDKDFFDLAQDAEGNLAVAGISADNQQLFAKLAPDGTELWRQALGAGAGVAAQVTTDGQYVFLGREFKTLHLIKMNSDGSIPAPEALVFKEGRLETSQFQAYFSPGPNLFATNTGDQPYFKSDDVGVPLGACLPWIGGFDGAGVLHCSGSTSALFMPSGYRPGVARGKPGEFNRVWRLDRATIDKFRLDYARDQELDDPVPFDILSWPAKNNPNLRYNSDFSPLVTPSADFPAPFVDVNADGVYNAYDGDYPDIKGDQMAWWVFTDSSTQAGGAPLLFDIAVSAYVYECPAEGAVENTLLVDLEIVNRSAQNYTDTYFGFFADPDLGCPEDDFFGSLPAENAVCLYNADAMDSPCPNFEGFGADIPICTAALLNQEMSHAMYCNNPSVGQPPVASTFPQLPQEYYNYMRGKWRSGEPLTAGGNGLNGAVAADWVFPDSPDDPGGWSMCSVSLPNYDRKIIFSSGPFGVQSGDTVRLTLAFAIHRGIPLPCPAVAGMVAPVLGRFRDWYAAGVLDIDPGLSPVYRLQAGQTLALDASVPGGQYTWSTGAFSPGIEVNSPGLYTVTITGETGCTHVENIAVEMGTATGEAPEQSNWQVWPVPAQQVVYLQAPYPAAQAVDLRIFDMQGRLTREYTAVFPGRPILLNDLKQGCYYVEIRDGAKISRQKIILLGP